LPAKLGLIEGVSRLRITDADDWSDTNIAFLPQWCGKMGRLTARFHYPTLTW